MANTELDITLTGSLLSELEQPGVDAYAVWFDNNETTPQWTVMINDGTLLNSGSIVQDGTTLATGTTIELPSQMPGGKIYFLIQSQDPANPIANLTTLITKQSQINFDSSSTYDYRYDSLEVTLKGAGTDVGNLTSVNGFGLPMEFQVNYTNVTNTISNGITNTVTAYSSGSTGYDVSGSTIEQNIGSISPSAIYDYTRRSARRHVPRSRLTGNRCRPDLGGRHHPAVFDVGLGRLRYQSGEGHEHRNLWLVQRRERRGRQLSQWRLFRLRPVVQR